jgi:hypothetical protein
MAAIASNEALTDCAGGRFGAVVDAKFAEQVGDVGFDRAGPYE